MPQLKVIRASAGSGKTYTLASEYLRLLFNESDYFRHILAVTFTNKATNEMKSRIIRELHRLATGQETPQIADLMEFTHLSEKQIRLKADIILKKILHQYSSFSVSTIDSFFQRIIRSFTRELGLQGTYTIELDTETLLTEVIDQLMIQAETDESLLSWLGNYAGSLIEKGDNWNFRNSIRTLGKEIFREEFKSIPDQVAWQFGNREILKQHKQELHSGLVSIEKEYREFGRHAKAILDKAGLNVDDFSMKTKGPAGFLLKLISGEFREPTATAIQSATSAEKWFTRNSPKAAVINLLAVSELMPLMQRVTEYYHSHFRLYFTFEVILQNIYTLGILSDLSNLAYRWCNENNAFLLPEAPLFLQKIIDGNDTPFIYEKAGYWYHHFMIDEFQDTSLLQWLNFKPLISNSLSQGYDNLVVGDVKQSIYRWRNSNFTILARGLEEDFPGGIVKSRSLDHNWRSGKNIIEFNNCFFRDAAKILDREFIAKLQSDGYPATGFENLPVSGIYSDARQSPGNKSFPQGFVEISFLKEDDENSYYDQVNRKLVVLLDDLFNKGYSPQDIAIITRKNREAKLLADFLLNYRNEDHGNERKFNVISDEALRLGSSSVVVFLASLLQYLVDPSNEISNYFMLSFFKNNLMPGHPNEQLIPANDSKSREFEIRNLMPALFFELVGSARAISLAEITEQLISIFNLNGFRGETVYLNAFRDLVQEFGQKYVADPARFLEYWNETGKEKSISAPAGQEAIRILTVHKSKGLEFNIVIIPYCNWELNPVHKSILWCKPREEPFKKMGSVPLNYSSKLMKTIFAGEYYAEFLSQYIDNLNLLYVAFTRACNGLFAFCRQENGDTFKSVSGLASNVISIPAAAGMNDDDHFFPGSFDESSSCYTYGVLPEKVTVIHEEPGESLSPASASIQVASERIKVAYQGRIYLDPAVNKPKRPLNEGKILHEIFTSIRTINDITRAVNGIYLKGRINRDEQELYLSRIKIIVNDSRVMPWFTEDWHVMTEAEIILPAGVSKRPDRVMNREGQTLIIDYKFGEKLDPAYNVQVSQYVELLRQMGYSHVSGYIWYVMMGQVILVE